MAHGDFQTRLLFAQPNIPAAASPPLSPAEQRVAAMRGDPSMRSEYARSVSIEVPGYRMALRFMEGLLEKANRTKHPGGLWILGDGGQGKSFVLQAFLRRHQPVQTIERIWFPVLYLRFAGRPAESDILLKILLMLGQNPETLVYQDNADLRKLVASAMTQCGVKVILFDEAQHVWLNVQANRVKDRIGGLLGDFLKSFYDETGVGYVFAGTPGLGDLLEVDKQAATRWSGILRLDAFKNDAGFKGLLQALDEALPMEEPAALSSEALSEKIYLACQGNFRRLKNFLSDAVHLAASDGARSIQSNHLAKAYFQNFCSEETPFGVVP